MNEQKKLSVREQRDRYNHALSLARAALGELAKSEGWSRRQRQSVNDQTQRNIERALRGEETLYIKYPEADGYEWTE